MLAVTQVDRVLRVIGRQRVLGPGPLVADACDACRAFARPGSQEKCLQCLVDRPPMG